MKVDDLYNSIKTNILMLPELPHVSTAYRMLYQEQKHKEIPRLNTTSASDSLPLRSIKGLFMIDLLLITDFIILSLLLKSPQLMLVIGLVLVSNDLLLFFVTIVSLPVILLHVVSNFMNILLVLN
ncbi:unnamed protein product [Amaranthus hypochondriacus]